MLFAMYPREGGEPGWFHSVTVAGEGSEVWLAVNLLGDPNDGDTVRLLPDEARSLARALMEAADAVEKGERT